MIEDSTALKIDRRDYRGLFSQTDLFDVEQYHLGYQPIGKSRFEASKKLLIDLGLILSVGLLVFSIFTSAWFKQTAPLRNLNSLKSISIQKGETLWQIAGRYAPRSVDRRQFIAKLIEINQLPSTNLREGQIISVPVYAD